jgi:drug/metabolite transporter (DMT)-like permease
MKIIHKGIFALIFVVLYSALVTVALQVGGSSIGAIPLLLYSSLFGTAIMLIVAYFQDRGRGLTLLLKDRKSLLILIITGVFAYAVSTLLLTWGTLGTTPSVSAIVYRTYPLIIALLTPFTLKQRVSGRQFLALLIGLVSVGIVMANGSITAINLSELPYIALVLLSALAVAATTIVIKKYNASTSGFVVIANIASAFFAVFLVLIFHISVPVNLSLPAVLSIFLIGGLDLGIGSFLFYYSYKTFTTSLAGLSTLVIPFLTIIFSFLILGTPLLPSYFLAASLLTAGIFLQERNALHAPERLKTNKTPKNMQIYDVTSAFAGDHTKDIYSHIKGGGRALAIKLHEGEHYDKMHMRIFGKRGCIAFTSTHPYKGVSKDEIEFLNKIIGYEKGEVILIAVGDPNKLELAFKEFKDKFA